jgi:fructoselysine-6-P-deglycase FrlB-like protein
MNSIDSMQKEIEYQKNELQRLDLPSQGKNCLFVGLGDSHVASLAAQYFSHGSAICCCPTYIISDPDIAEGRNTYFVSVSGNTKANIQAALIAKKHAKSITAITANPRSKLAEACTSTIDLKYKSTGGLTPGTISFTSSMLTCISLASNFKTPQTIEAIYNRADRKANYTADNIKRGLNYFILGNGILELTSRYGALKFNEVFGAKSIPCTTEEFCHSPLFSITESDRVIIMGSKSDGIDLHSRLQKEGFSSTHIKFEHMGIALLLESTFFMQLLVLKLAFKFGIVDCFFLKNKQLLDMSSDFIY